MRQRKQARARVRVRKLRRNPFHSAPNVLGFLFSRKNSIYFKTWEGRKIVISKHAFRNIYLDKKGTLPRALVPIMVDGEHLFFYRSSGQSSHTPGVWYPTYGPDYEDLNHKRRTYVGMMVKTRGHHQYSQKEFPEWVLEVSKKLKHLEGRIIFHPKWGAREYYRILDALSGAEINYELGFATP